MNRPPRPLSPPPAPSLHWERCWTHVKALARPTSGSTEKEDSAVQVGREIGHKFSPSNRFFLQLPLGFTGKPLRSADSVTSPFFLLPAEPDVGFNCEISK
ncbi:hypothetical protein E2C01_060586 [Portunus trituberculatus]|uniref:Uncharacterized protein n=1 Tax=Portunus trituberculatus TaxID=210409 RepID=A0A5B7H9F8_PORTR|nr:hypothetical protein [Portunus trituberculatus]